MSHHIYAHITHDNKVFYIGKSKRLSRMNDKRNRNIAWKAFTANRVWKAVKICNCVSDEHAALQEIFFIRLFRSLGNPLVNVTDGGELSPDSYLWPKTQAAQTQRSQAGKLGGSANTSAKQRASKENGKLGGRPRKQPPRA